MSEIPQLNTQELRKFGFVTGIIVAGLFGLFLPFLLSKPLANSAFYIAGFLIILAIVFPNGLDPIYKVWMRIGLTLGWINTRIILALVFYLILTPISFLLRIFKDPMTRKFDKNVDSYRVISKEIKLENAKRPF
jgi:hypothetical protein